MPVGVQLQIDTAARQLTDLGQGHQLEQAVFQDHVVIDVEERRQPREQRVLEPHLILGLLRSDVAEGRPVWLAARRKRPVSVASVQPATTTGAKRARYVR